MELVLGRKLLEASEKLEGKQPLTTTNVALHSGEVQLLIRAVQLVEAVREVIPKR